MKISVFFSDGTSGAVRASELEGLIKSRRIIGFRRYGEWVRVGYDPVRGRGGHYNGPERREDYIRFGERKGWRLLTAQDLDSCESRAVSSDKEAVPSKSNPR